ncbi:YesL family protein [Aquibacillus saliphilus]|uniref:YesL family protein n=1 Tax=Aquibacillus saliphilus TaxID=1909422 RepID=UPI001CF0CCB1|nr:YesL family protein [Aquibacillus saliphilus]
MSKSSIGPLFAITEWITKFAYVNFLWIIFTFVGLVFFGFFPATIAMFTLMRKWLIGNSEIPVFKTFWTTYKKEFIKSNLIGLIIFLFAGIVYADLRFMESNPDSLLIITQIPLYLFIFTFVLTLLYLFPVYVHYDVKIYQMFKNAFLIMLVNPLYNLMMIAGIIVTYFSLTFIPGLIFFFGGSVMTYIIMWPCYQAFQKIEQKKEQISEVNS